MQQAYVTFEDQSTAIFRLKRINFDAMTATELAAWIAKQPPFFVNHEHRARAEYAKALYNYLTAIEFGSPEGYLEECRIAMDRAFDALPFGLRW